MHRKGIHLLHQSQYRSQKTYTYNIRARIDNPYEAIELISGFVAQVQPLLLAMKRKQAPYIFKH